MSIEALKKGAMEHMRTTSMALAWVIGLVAAGLANAVGALGLLAGGVHADRRALDDGAGVVDQLMTISRLQ